MKKLKILIKYRILKSLIFNFKMLPFKQAKKLPIIFVHKTRFINLKGKVEINCPIKRGMIYIGAYHSELMTPLFNTIDLKGKIIFNGPIHIGCGVLIKTENNGTITFGKQNVIGANCKIICEKKITIDDYTRIGWESQIFDTNFHYLRDTLTNEIIPKDKEIRIGKYNWIGNRSSIMKGTRTHENTIISSNSLCNKDYTKITNPECIIGGVPAKLIVKNKVRIFNKEVERKIDNDLHGKK